MNRLTVYMILITVLCAFGCGDATHEPEIADSEATAPRQAPATTELDPENPDLIVRPFTADQIRAEWVEGLRLMIRRSFPEATTIERWTVVAADDEGAEIEYATVADDGSVEDEPSIKRTSWTELRDHASFPAAHSTRRWVTRSTQLGEFEGWLYRVADPEKATVQEFFFVPSLPGAPVQMRIVEGEDTVFEMEQMARLRPADG